jgi:short-subunit dehydrogenase
VELARGGYHVVLTGRNESALQATAQECASRYQVETDIVVADLAHIDQIQSLVTQLQSKPRRYEALVNNAGFGVHGEFAATELDRELDMLNVQLAAALQLTKALLPSMIAGRQGHILNVASVYAFGPVPSQAVYAACKAFLLSFSSALHDEVKGSGVKVTVFCPGITQTEFRSRAGIADKGTSSGVTAEHAAQMAYAAMRRGQHMVVPGLANRVFFLLSRLLPSASFASLVRWINRQRGLSEAR